MVDVEVMREARRLHRRAVSALAAQLTETAQPPLEAFVDVHAAASARIESDPVFAARVRALTETMGKIKHWEPRDGAVAVLALMPVLDQLFPEGPD